MSFREFILKWTHPDYPAAKVDARSIWRAERQLGTLFPNAYCETLVEFGAPSPSISLLHSISERGLPIPDVFDFFVPERVIESTLSWRKLGMPNDLVAFASDCSGNLFCFPVSAVRLAEAPILFWDHDFDEVTEVGASFNDWIAQYCAIDLVEED